MANRPHGNPKQFLTREEQLEYRTLTTLLELTDVLQSAGPNEVHGKLIRLPNMELEAQGCAPDLKLYELLSHFTNMTIRHHEVVALVPEDKDAGRVSLIKGPEFHNEQEAEGGADVEFEESPDPESEAEHILPRAVLLTRNPTKDDHKPKEDSIIPALEAEIRSAEIQLEDEELIGLFFLRTREFIDNRYTRELPFEQHAHILVHLLQKNHTAKVDPEFVKSRRRLFMYIFLASGGKMLSRMYNGMVKKGGKNLWSVLSREITGLAHGADDILTLHLSDDVPSDDERQTVRMLLDYWLRKGVVDQEEMDQLDISSGTRPLYDRQGRQRFQTILHLCTTQAFKSLENLEKAKKSSSKEVKKGSGNILEIAENLEDFAIGAMYGIRNLSIFRRTFRKKIVLHLSWLAKIFEVKSTIAKGKKKYAFQNREFESSSSPSTSAVPSSDPKHASSDPAHPASDPAAMSHTAASEPHTSIPHVHFQSSDIASSDVPEPSSELVIEDFRDMSMDQASNEDADDDMELEDLSHQDDGWEAATQKYMELMCLHYEASRILSAKRKPDTFMRYVGSLIQKVNLSTVHVEPENNDQTMIQIPLFLETFRIEPGREMSQVECNHIQEWLVANTKAQDWPNGLESDLFFGTWHCECLLMSLHLLSSADPGDVYLTPDAALAENDHHLHLPGSDVLEKFKNIQSLLMVSKRCCPACYQLVNLVRQKQSRDKVQVMIYPGYHVTWSSVALPPWLLREYAMPILEHAREVLAMRLNELLILIVDGKDRNPRQRSKSFGSDMNLQEGRLFSKEIEQLEEIEELEDIIPANKKRKIS